MAYLDEHLPALAQSDPAARRAALETLLTALGLPWTVQECEAGEKQLRGLHIKLRQYKSAN